MTDQAPTAAEHVTEDGSTISHYAEKYFKVREILRTMEMEYKEKTERYKILKDNLSVRILGLLQAQGLQNARTPLGTVFPTERTTASLSDPEAFMQHVIANQQFDLLDRKANMTAVRDYVEKHNVLPPGCNLNTIIMLGAHKKVGGAAKAGNDTD